MPKAKSTVFEVQTEDSGWDTSDGVVVFLDKSKSQKNGLEAGLGHIPEALRADIISFSMRSQYLASEGQSLVFDRNPKQRVVVVPVSSKQAMFSLLEKCRQALSPMLSCKVHKYWVDLRAVEHQYQLVDAWVSALVAAQFEAPSKKKEKTAASKAPHVQFVVSSKHEGGSKEQVVHSQRLGQATNLVRTLVMTAGNDLGPSSYVKRVEQIARENELDFSLVSHSELQKMGAGAFLAVSQGSADKGGGIACVKYEAPNSRLTVALVGKGITFDTGGSNLKTGQYMFGMHGDMAGSAVVLAVVCAAKQLNWPISIEAYLAIAENSLSRDSYRPNDVVVSLSGKSIEVVDTDAEGRMVLADTLTYVSRTKPDLIMDFATLTGTCIRAIGTNYAGAFTNKNSLMTKIIRSGKLSGERVWPFPLDADYGRCLKSEVADTKQCRNSGGVDHIEAAFFLKQFLDVPSTDKASQDKPTPWVHVDLASAEHEGGLAHVGTDVTGFGVRFCAEFIEQMTQNSVS